LSDDGTQGLTLITFVGSVFSPYYAWARRRGAADPVNHCAFNIALYGAKGARWAMTERGASKVIREKSFLSIGPSSISWTGEALEITLDEICAPLPRRIRGRVRLVPRTLCGHSFALGESGLHRWAPHAPCARVEVQLTEPNLRWSGDGYLDSNVGEEPLENGFSAWHWSRAALRDGTVVLYDYQARSAPASSLALKFDHTGNARQIELPPEAPLRPTAWRVSRRTRADVGSGAAVRQTLEDGPFYSRSILDTHLLGEPVTAFHESLSLDRFRSRWVQCLLPFRMPRAIR